MEKPKFEIGQKVKVTQYSSKSHRPNFVGEIVAFRGGFLIFVKDKEGNEHPVDESQLEILEKQ